jgi:transposase
MSPEGRVRADHPLRRIKRLADEALAELHGVFEAMYSDSGRPSIPPERLLKSMLLMALYTVRSERLFCEQLDYNLLFRWFLEMDMVEASFDPSTFSKNRERLLVHDVARAFFGRVVEQARRGHLLSSEHFTVDGTLIEAWASLKSFKPKRRDSKEEPLSDDPGNPSIDFHGQKRSNETHQSTTDSEAKLARKGDGKEAKLCFSGHALMENRHGLVVEIQVAEASGVAERRVALDMIDDVLPGERRITLGADRGYHSRDFVRACRDRNVTPHLADKTRASALDRRTTAMTGYAISQRVRKRVEEIFGWVKTVGGLRKTRFRGIARTRLSAYMVGAAYNLLRIARLIPARS